VLAVILVGTTGYILIEGWSPLDAAYMTIITLTTVGFGEVHKLSVAGRQFTIVLVVTGVIVGGYAAATLTSFVVEGHLTGALRARRKHWRLAAMENHIVICGLGRVGRAAVQGISRQGVPCVAVDEHSVSEEGGEIPGVETVQGDATNRETLLRAGVQRARGIICALRSDAENIMLALTLQELAPDALVVARSDSEEADHLLRRAGADVVISPYRAGGEQLANAITRPGVHSFVEVFSAGGSGETHLDELDVVHGSPLIGTALSDLHTDRDTGVRIVGICRPWGEPVLSPRGSTILTEGDRLVLAGTDAQIRDFVELVREGAGR